jgi:hypothetical protein
MQKLFFLFLVLISTVHSLVLEESVQVGKLVELNSEASIWMRCDAASQCESNIKPEVLAKIVSYKSPKMVQNAISNLCKRGHTHS